jgi:hypothetical protein
MSPIPLSRSLLSSSSPGVSEPAPTKQTSILRSPCPIIQPQSSRGQGSAALQGRTSRRLNSRRRPPFAVGHPRSLPAALRSTLYACPSLSRFTTHDSRRQTNSPRFRAGCSPTFTLDRDLRIQTAPPHGPGQAAAHFTSLPTRPKHDANLPVFILVARRTSPPPPQSNLTSTISSPSSAPAERPRRCDSTARRPL